jgi:hypothetical protein
MRAYLWVYQSGVTPKQPASFGFGACVPIRPADLDGWLGYWWAANPAEADSGENSPVLIRARDVFHAVNGDGVVMFAPGIWGTPYITVFSDWMPRHGRGYFAFYEGETIPGYNIDGEWELFRPIRQLELLTVREFRERLDAFEAEEANPEVAWRCRV